MRTDSYGSVLRGPVSTHSKAVPERIGWGETERNSILHLQQEPVHVGKCTLDTHTAQRMKQKEKKDG